MGIAKWLGHADASITARIYAHSQDDALREASATLGQVVTPKSNFDGTFIIQVSLRLSTGTNPVGEIHVGAVQSVF